jgi:hypothetical protein
MPRNKEVELVGVVRPSVPHLCLNSMMLTMDSNRWRSLRKGLHRAFESLAVIAEDRNLAYLCRRYPPTFLDMQCRSLFTESATLNSVIGDIPIATLVVSLCLSWLYQKLIGLKNKHKPTLAEGRLKCHGS